jgi:membrane protein YdbS with pleckstrin-like domain
MLYGQLSNSLIHQLTNTLHASRDTLHEIALQLSRELYKSNLFLQNKANFKNVQIYASACNTNSYGNLVAFSRRKNKAKQSQNKPNFSPKLALFFPKLAFTRLPKPAKSALLAKISIIQKTFCFPIYKVMETEINEKLKTKLCPFCAEVIQQQAVKCRFCGEILSPDRIKAVEKAVTPAEQGSKNNERILYAGRPSLWAMAGTCVKALIVLAFAYFLTKYPLENLPVFAEAETESSVPAPNYSGYEAENYTPADNGTAANYGMSAEAENTQTAARPSKPFYIIELTANQIAAISKYRVIFGMGLFIFVPLVLLYKAFKLKMMHYEVTPERIEFSRGILDRKVDNIDMFRVIDLKMRRSLLDCIVGVGTVGLITTDKTDPEFNFEKVHRARRLYDTIKRASLEADRTTNVVHLE